MPFRITRWNLLLTVACLLLGLLLSLGRGALPSLAPPSQASGDVFRDPFSDGVKRLEEEQKALKKQVEDLQRELQTYQESASRQRTTLAEISQDLEKQRMVAGVVPLRGKGVKVVLDDSLRTPQKGEDVGHYLVHDYQLRDVLSLIWQAGAEAISINGERIVGTTSIYCVGSTLIVNNTRLSPPYEFLAIGNPVTLEATLNDPRFLSAIKSEAKLYGLQFVVQKADDVVIPAYSGSFSLRYARVSS